MIYTCKHCGREFNDKASDKRVFCSRQCKGASERVFDSTRLAALAEEGLENREIAAAMQISRSRVNRILHTHGLHDLWRRKRYERQQRQVYRRQLAISARRRRDPKIVCLNSLLAGWKLVHGASDETITPSASTV